MSLHSKLSHFARLGGITVLLLIVAEVFTREFVTSPSIARFDSVLKWTYEPNVESFSASEGGARLTLNSLGLNDDELPEEKKEHRVLALGDSFVVALQVERRQNFLSLSNQELKCMRFVNAGRAALQPFQMMVLRDRLKKPLQIDSLLLVLNTNDIFGIDGRVTITSVTDTEVLWKQDVHNEGSLRPLIEPLIKNSALAGWLASRLQVAVAEPEGPPKTGAPRQVSKEKRRILQAFLQHMKKEDEFRILYIPAMSFMGERFSEMTPDAKTAWTVIEEESKSLSIPIINLDRFLIDSFSHSGQPGVGFPNRIVGNIHLNPQGHIAAAKAIKELYQGSCR